MDISIKITVEHEEVLQLLTEYVQNKSGYKVNTSRTHVSPGHTGFGHSGSGAPTPSTAKYEFTMVDSK